MNLLLLLRIMNRFALVFAVFNLLFALAGYQGGGILAFLGISVATWAAAGLRRSLKPLVPVLPVLILAWAGGWPRTQMFYLGLVAAYALYIAFRGLETYLEAVTDDFNAGATISLGLLALSLASFNLAAFERSAAPFILLYLVSSVVTLRTAREMAASGRTSALGHLISVGLVITAAVLCSPMVRHFVLHGLKGGYTFLVEAVIYLLGGFLLAVGRVLAAVLEFLTSLARQKGVRMPPSEQVPWMEEILKLKGPGSFGRLLDSRYLSLLGQLLLLGLAGFVLVRAFRRYRGPAAKDTGFTEVRETIPMGNGTPRAGRSIFQRRPADPARAVRFYYGQFLRLCLKREVALRSSDTTEEINGKARAVFAGDTLAKLRRIYVAVRYGGQSAGEDAAGEAGKCYRDLKSQKGT